MMAATAYFTLEHLITNSQYYVTEGKSYFGLFGLIFPALTVELVVTAIVVHVVAELGRTNLDAETPHKSRRFRFRIAYLAIATIGIGLFGACAVGVMISFVKPLPVTGTLFAAAAILCLLALLPLKVNPN